MSTSRNIANVEVKMNYPIENIVEMQKLKEIIMNFGSCIRSLEIQAHLSMLDFNEIIASVPKLKSLNLELHGLPGVENDLIHDKKVLNLRDLRILKLQQCDEKFAEIFKRLPPHTIRELSWDMESGKEILHKILKKQQKITKLSTNTPFPLSLFCHLKLEELDWQCKTIEPEKLFAEALQKQSDLKVLSLGAVVSLDFISSLKKLNGLKNIKFTLKRPEKDEIRKLTNIRQIEWKGEDDSYLREFTDTHHPMLEKLSMYSKWPLGKGTLQWLASSAPNLKEARFETNHSCASINNILRHFNRVEALRIVSNGTEQLRGRTERLCRDSYDEIYNENLKELKIVQNFTFKNIFAQKLVASYPNLEILVVSNPNSNAVVDDDGEEDRLARNETIKDFMKLKELTVSEFSGEISSNDDYESDTSGAYDDDGFDWSEDEDDSVS